MYESSLDRDGYNFSISICTNIHFLLLWIFLYQLITASVSFHWWTADKDLTLVLIFSIKSLRVFPILLYAESINLHLGFDKKLSLWCFNNINKLNFPRQFILPAISKSFAICFAFFVNFTISRIITVLNQFCYNRKFITSKFQSQKLSITT